METKSPITIMEARLESLSITTKDVAAIEGSYSLVSSVGKTLATQAFNGYSPLKIKPSAATEAALKAFLESFQGDIHNTIGL